MSCCRARIRLGTSDRVLERDHELERDLELLEKDLLLERDLSDGFGDTSRGLLGSGKDGDINFLLRSLGDGER